MRSQALELSELGHILSMFNVDITSWGKGNAKTLDHLLKEVQNREVTLELNDRLLLRKVRVLNMTIQHPKAIMKDKVLIEKKQILPCGRVREVNRKPAGKICAHETYAEALERELIQELKLTPDQYVFTLEKIELINSRNLAEERALSFPCLETLYEIHYILIGLNRNVPCEPYFCVEDNDGKKLHFAWEDSAQYKSA